jgi:hypothetical protein
MCCTESKAELLILLDAKQAGYRIFHHDCVRIVALLDLLLQCFLAFLLFQSIRSTQCFSPHCYFEVC